MNTKHNANGIFDIEYQQHRRDHYISKSLCTLLADYLPKDRVVYDFGCGTGEYLYHLKQEGFQVIGHDGTPGISNVAYVPVVETDLTKPMPPAVERGSVISIEVGEHIPQKFEQTFIENIDKYVDEHLVISWALPGQGGVGHVNELPSAEVIKKFEAHGFTYNRAESEKWRATITELQWLKNTLHIFTRTKAE